MDNLPGVALILKKGTKEIVASNNAACLIGAMRGKTCYETCFDRQEVCTSCQASLMWETNERVESEVKDNGVWYHSIWVPLDDDLFVHHLFDSTERKRAEEALAQSEERFKRLFQLAPMGYQSLDEDANYLEVNDAWCRTLGYRRDEVIGHNFGEFIDPDFRDIYKRCFPKFKNDGTLDGVELTLIKKDGSRIIAFFVGRVGYNDDGSFKQTHCIFTDITERKRAEQEIEKQTYYLTKAQEIGHIGTWELDLITNALIWTDENYRVFGLPSGSDLTYETFLGRIHPDDRAYVDREWKAAIEGKPYDIEHRLMIDGKVKWVREKAEIRFDGEGRAVTAIGFTQDITERKEAEQVLIERDYILRESQRVAALGSYDLDIASGAWTSSDVLNTVFGIDADFRKDIEGWVQIIHLEHQEDMLTYFSEEVVGKHRPFDREYQITRSNDGESRWVHGLGKLEFDAEGKPIRMIGTIQDITERRQIEADVRIERDRAQMYLDIAGSILVALDLESKVTLINRAGCEALGYPKDDIIGKNWFENFLPELDRESTRVAFDQLVVGEIEQVEFFENPILTSSGGTRLMAWHNSILRDSRGKITGLLSSGEDITERKRAEEALHESEEKFRSIVQGSPMGMHMYRLEPNDRLIFTGANPAADTILGVDHRQFIGKTIEEAFPAFAGTDVPEEYRLVAKEGKPGSTEQIEYEHEQIKGGFEVHTFQTAPGTMAAMFLDITERKNAEREREKLIVELETKNAELERFAYTVSHDLKGPLITITGFAGLLAAHAAEGDQAGVDDDTDRIARAADKMAGLLDSLLQLSRVGRIVNPFVTICMDDLAREVIELTSGRAQGKGIDTTVIPGMPTFLGDRPRILEVVQNLLDNAFKYMGDQSHPQVEIGSRRRGDETQFYVRDNGIGIDQRYHEKVFGLFDQLDPEIEGSGVGLALVKRIVENHGGRVFVESNGDNQGSTFYFTVPSLKPHPSKQEVVSNA